MATDPIAAEPLSRAELSAAAAGALLVRRTGDSVAVAIVGLDHFGSVNAALGRPAGDEVLGAVVERLRALGAAVARFGGDEFAVLMAGAAAGHLGDIVVDALRAPFEVASGRSVRLGASIGLAVAPDDANDVGELLEHAEEAMQLAKERGGGIALRLAGEARAEHDDRRALASALADALANRELALTYQPIVETRSRRLEGAEAFVSWKHPALGVVQPARFLRLAQESGLIVPLGEWVLREACRQAARWQRLTPLRLVVDVTVEQFDDGALCERVAAALETSGLDPERLELDLPGEALTDSIRDLDRLGVKLAVDDFGGAPVALSALGALPVSTVKLDRTLIAGVSAIEGEGTAALAAGMIRLARDIGLGVVGKGVATAKQAAFLGGQGCDRIQGDLISGAVAADRFEALLGGGAAVARTTDSANRAPVKMPPVRPARRPSIRRAVPVIALGVSAAGVTVLASGDALAVSGAGQRTIAAFVRYVGDVVPSLPHDDHDARPDDRRRNPGVLGVSGAGAPDVPAGADTPLAGGRDDHAPVPSGPVAVPPEPGESGESGESEPTGDWTVPVPPMPEGVPLPETPPVSDPPAGKERPPKVPDPGGRPLEPPANRANGAESGAPQAHDGIRGRPE